MKNHSRRILLFAIGLLTVHTASAQPQTTATLRVKTDIVDVEVWLDNEAVGRTPLTLKNLTAGKHRISLLKDGYEDHLEDVDITAGQSKSIFVVMKSWNLPLPDMPVKFKVIHQHFFGSCVGMLTLSVEALDFKAENDDDQFHIPIANIKSVLRRGPTSRGQIPTFVSISSEGLPVSIDMRDNRSYSFRAFKETRKDSVKVASSENRELYELLYRLWSARLTPPQKSKD